MKRRDFVALVGGAAAWPLAARAQQAGRLKSVGLFIGPSQDDPETKRREAGFLDKFRELGWVDGRTVSIHRR